MTHGLKINYYIEDCRYIGGHKLPLDFMSVIVANYNTHMEEYA